MKDLVIPLFDKLGFKDAETDDYSVLTLRSRASWWACALGHPPCVESARKFFHIWLQNTKDIRYG